MGCPAPGFQLWGVGECVWGAGPTQAQMTPELALDHWAEPLGPQASDIERQGCGPQLFEVKKNKQTHFSPGR